MPPTSHLKHPRLIALDVFRGMTLVLMMIVNNPGDWGAVYAPLLHADWHGCTLTDLVFPFFLFIVGVAIPFALGSRKDAGTADPALYRKIIIRVILIFLIGLVLSGFPYYNLTTIRIPGVLQRIAIVYGVVAILFLKVSVRGLWISLAICLAGYWFLMTKLPVPGYGYASLQPETNLGAWLDYTLLKGHLWSSSRVWDPEGILSTLPAFGTGILGLWTGIKLRSKDQLNENLHVIFFTGAVLMLLGYVWDMSFPINKKIWTSSYVLFTGGMAMLTLASLIWLIDIKGFKNWTRHFIYFGMNSMVVFVGSGLLARILGLIKWYDGGKTTNLKSFLYRFYQYDWMPLKLSSLLFAFSLMVVFYLFLKWLYHKKWFWRL
ncbi:MAG: DUF5009 domain-containing protein [Saprospiraceae bacterium]|nr:DUF5009 domain-containing protein [Saprospiraceae bacterium]